MCGNEIVKGHDGESIAVHGFIDRSTNIPSFSPQLDHHAKLFDICVYGVLRDDLAAEDRVGFIGVDVESGGVVVLAFEEVVV